MTKEEGIAEIRAWVKDLKKVGTPENISDEAREGFELMVEEVADFDADITAESLDSFEESLSESEKKASEAFDKYSADTCGSVLDNQELPEVPTPSS